MAEQFYTILTQIGKAQIANASALGTKVEFKYFALGDGNGNYYNPTENQTELVNEVWRGQIGQVVIDEENPNWIVLETIIPASVGGFNIREAGVFDENNNLLAIGKYPETYKPKLEDGSAKDLYIRMILEVANTSVVTLKVDPSIILATKKDIDILSNRITKNTTNISDLQQELETHKEDDVSQGEVHGLRVNNGKLEYYDGDWKIASGGIPVGNVSGLSIKEGDAEITLTWTDPDDRYLDDVKIAEWQGTKIIRKEGSYPVSDDDGVLVVDNTIRNQYSTNGYKDTGLTNEVTYYYMAFPYTEDAITVDGANRVAGTPSPLPFDNSGSPGPSKGIAGNMQEGFFGEVSASELITGDALASECGISQGTSQHSTAGWLKFAWKGNVQFVAKKPIRHSISWDAINAAKCVYGDSGGKTVTIDGLTYKVTLMKGANDKFNPKQPIKDQTGGGNGYNGEVNHGSEWNRLMCQIHEQALNKSWDYPGNIESDIGILEHNLGNGNQGMYNDADLIVASGDGRLSWCQEMSTSTSDRLLRGYEGVSYSSGYHASSGAGSGCGWRPVLRLIG